MKYYYKVKYGFHSSEFVSIEAGPDLERAIYAKIERMPVTLRGKLIDGKTILLIEPHVNKYTGWYETYQPTTGEDYAQIERDMPKEVETTLDQHYDFVRGAISSGRTDMIGTGQALSLPSGIKNNLLR